MIDKKDWARIALVSSELMEMSVEELQKMRVRLYDVAIANGGPIEFLRNIVEWYGTRPTNSSYQLDERMGNRTEDDHVEINYDQMVMTVTLNNRVVVSTNAEKLFAPGPWYGWLEDKYRKRLDEDIKGKEEQALKAQKNQIISEIALITQ